LQRCFERSQILVRNCGLGKTPQISSSSKLTSTDGLVP
jgi:hypothetical protein